jgi:Zn-finger nucleic acid-binding protein
MSGTMQCPRDGSRLEQVHVVGLELDKCHRCDGIWCDHGEMERLRDSSIAGIEEVIEQEHGSPVPQGGEVHGYMTCPRCGKRLQRFRYTWLNPVEIDRCEGCWGVWLDDSELNAIIGEKQELEEHDNVVKRFFKSILGRGENR